MDEHLRYTSDIELLIRRLREKGKTDHEIIRELCWACTYTEVRELAKKWAANFDLTPAEFIQIARPRGKETS